MLWFSGIHGRGTLGAYKGLLENAVRLLVEVRKLGNQEDVAVSCLVRIRYPAASRDASLEGIEAEILGQPVSCGRKAFAERRRALFVDLGGVLMDFDRTRTYRAIAHQVAMDYRVVQQAIESTDLRSRYERGLLSDEDFCQSLCDLFGERAGNLLRLLPEFWGDIFWPNYEMFGALKCLKSQGVPLLLLSNTNGLHFSHVSKDYPEIIGLFDHCVLSYQFGDEKPAPGVFDAAVDWVSRHHRVARSDVLYVDDMEDFVQAGRSLGLNGFVYRSYAHFVFWLRKQGLYVP